MDTSFGSYSADGSEYIITDPNTPMPWVNVISNGDYGFVISEAGSGYSWRTHAGLNRITRWDQDLLRDEWGKYLFVRDSERGKFLTATQQPAGAELEDNAVRHVLGYTVISGNHDGLES